MRKLEIEPAIVICAGIICITALGITGTHIGYSIIAGISMLGVLVILLAE